MSNLVLKLNEVREINENLKLSLAIFDDIRKCNRFLINKLPKDFAKMAMVKSLSNDFKKMENDIRNINQLLEQGINVLTKGEREFVDIFTKLYKNFRGIDNLNQKDIKYIIKPGDTLWSIAEKYLGDGSRYQELVDYNQIENPDLIYAGDTLKIPGKESFDFLDLEVSGTTFEQNLDKRAAFSTLENEYQKILETRSLLNNEKINDLTIEDVDYLNKSFGSLNYYDNTGAFTNALIASEGTNFFASDLLEKINPVLNIGQIVGATVVTAVQSLLKGILNFIEALVDLSMILNAAIKSIATGMVDGVSYLISGKTLGLTSLVWKDTMTFVSTKHVDNLFSHLYNTRYGQWLEEYSFIKSDSIAAEVLSGIGYTAGIIILTIITFGAGGVAAGGTGATSAITGFPAMGAGLIGGAAGMGKGTETAWANIKEAYQNRDDNWQNTSNLFKGLSSGLLNGILEFTQWFVGIKVGTGVFVNSSFSFLKRLANSGIKVGLHSLLGAVVVPGSALTNAVYNEKGFKDSWEKVGGTKQVIFNAVFAGLLSMVGEAFDLRRAIKYDKIISRNLKRLKKVLPDNKISVSAFDGYNLTATEFNIDQLFKILYDDTEFQKFINFNANASHFNQGSVFEYCNAILKLADLSRNRGCLFSTVESNRINIISNLYNGEINQMEMDCRNLLNAISQRGMKTVSNLNGENYDITIKQINNFDYNKQPIPIKVIENIIDDMPGRVKSMIKEINLYDCSNPYDPFWKRAYNNPHHHSAATGGDGVINIYAYGFDPFKKHSIPDLKNILAHEVGHSFDRVFLDRISTNPLWETAVKADYHISFKTSPTKYGETNLREDFAESFSLFLADPSKFSKEFPNRASILKTILSVK